MEDLSIYINVVPCLHRNVVLETSGGMHYSAGEVWDDIQEQLLCLDCMQYVTEAEVRAAQHNKLPNINQTTQMEITHDHA